MADPKPKAQPHVARIMKHSDAHILEVSKSQANQWIKAMELCRRRILDTNSDSVFADRLFRLEVEIHFFLVALLRFYRALALADTRLPNNPHRKERVRKFHEYIGIKRTMRNVGEHFDDYLAGRGHNPMIDTRGLQVWSMEVNQDNVRFTWLDETFDLKRTMGESERLWQMFLEDYRKVSVT